MLEQAFQRTIPSGLSTACESGLGYHKALQIKAYKRTPMLIHHSSMVQQKLSAEATFCIKIHTQATLLTDIINFRLRKKSSTLKYGHLVWTNLFLSR